MELKRSAVRVCPGVDHAGVGTSTQFGMYVYTVQYWPAVAQPKSVVPL